MTKPVVSFTVPNTPIFNQAGQIDFTWLKWFQNIAQTINGAFDQQGNFDGGLGIAAYLVARNTTTLALILQNIDDAGIVKALGIDFARNYTNKDTDHITDGTGSPLAGGKIAYAAMVTSGPLTGQILVFDGAHWLPHAKANTIASGLHEWLKSYDSASGNFTQTQPDFTDLSGRAALTQLGTGTPGAGKYVDGGSGAWTALPGGGTSLFNEQVAQVAGVFTLAHVPVSDGAGNPAVVLYNGSARLFPGLSNDYTISGAVITPTYSIPAGSLWADYQY